jgi:hypothetical protein
VDALLSMLADGALEQRCQDDGRDSDQSMTRGKSR